MPGLVVVEVAHDGQAARVGIRQYDVIFKYNGNVLHGIEDIALSETKEENELLVIRCRELLKFTVARGSIGVSLAQYPIPDVAIEGVGEIIARFKNEETEESLLNQNARRKIQEAQNQEIMLQIASVQSTTTPSLEGYKITQHIDIVTAEYVAGVNVIREFFADITDAIGGRSGALQMELREMRESCLINLKKEAHAIGANAVVGVSLNYSEISGGGKSMLFLVASGTAVIVEKIN